MKSVKLLQICWVIVVVAACTRVPAQQNTDIVLKLFEVSKPEQCLDIMYGAASLHIRDMFLEPGEWPDEYSDAEVLDAANTIATIITDLMREHLSWEVLEDIYVEIYQKHFSERELLDAIAHYESESGRSIVKKSPAIVTEAAEQMFKNLMQAEKLIQLEPEEILATLPSTVPISVEIYKKHLTDEEYLDAAAYSASETGRSMMQKYPAAMAEMSQLIWRASTRLETEVEKTILNYLLTLE